MFEGIMLRAEYVDWVKKLERDLQPAVLQGKTECVRCGLCCARRPCIPTPDELKAIAEFLGMELEEVVKTYFVGDRLGSGDIEYIFPAKHTQKDIVGEFVSARRTFDKGYCIFFDEEKKTCTIHEVKPTSAKDSKCWENVDTATPALETWRGEDITTYGIERY